MDRVLLAADEFGIEANWESLLAVSDLELCVGYLLEQDQQQLQMFALWTALPYLALKLLFVVFYFVAIGQ